MLICLRVSFDKNNFVNNNQFSDISKSHGLSIIRRMGNGTGLSLI